MIQCHLLEQNIMQGHLLDVEVSPCYPKSSSHAECIMIPGIYLLKGQIQTVHPKQLTLQRRALQGCTVISPRIHIRKGTRFYMARYSTFNTETRNFLNGFHRWLQVRLGPDEWVEYLWLFERRGQDDWFSNPKASHVGFEAVDLLVLRQVQIREKEIA